MGISFYMSPCLWISIVPRSMSVDNYMGGGDNLS